MSDNSGTRVSIDTIEALVYAKAVDKAAEHFHSERGFNASMRVASDRPSRVKRWSPGMTVSPQRVYQSYCDSTKQYKIATRDAQPLKPPSTTKFTVFVGEGLVTRGPKPKPGKRDITGMTISEAIFA